MIKNGLTPLPTYKTCINFLKVQGESEDQYYEFKANGRLLLTKYLLKEAKRGNTNLIINDGKGRNKDWNCLLIFGTAIDYACFCC